MDYLPVLNYPIKQEDSMFKMNSDTHHLGIFMRCKEKDIVLDLGCNNGVLLLYASRFKPKAMIGIDIQAEAITLAHENMVLNNLEDVCLKCMDFADFNERVDVIVCNPPYFRGDHRNKHESLSLARHEASLSLGALFKKSSTILKDKGRLFIIYPVSDIEELFVLGRQYGLTCKRMKIHYKESKQRGHTVCLEFVKGAKAGLIAENYSTIK